MSTPKPGLKACTDPNLLFKELDIASRRIEALDRSMMTIRQLYFVVLGILLAGLTSVVKNLDLAGLVVLVDILTVVVCSIGILLWQLDSHYHQYLREAVWTCQTIEKRLGYNLKNRLGLALNLERWRNDTQSGKIIPAKLYLLPVLGSLAGMLSLTTVWGVENGVDDLLFIMSYFIGIYLISTTIGWMKEIRKFIDID
jgi:hypothetical protein